MDEYLNMQLREFEKSTDELINEYETVDIDQLLAELEYEFNKFLKAFLRDMDSTDLNITESDYELFDEMVNRMPVYGD